MKENITENFVSSKRQYTGNVIGVDEVLVTIPSGKNATRDVVVHPGGAAIVPLTPDGFVYLVKQYRTPVGRALLEIPAGKLDPFEDPLLCAKRELLEETGISDARLQKLTSIHTTPGFSNETLHIYLATNFKVGVAKLDQDEFLTVEKHPINDLLIMIEKQEITDAKTIIGILMAKMFYPTTTLPSG